MLSPNIPWIYNSAVDYYPTDYSDAIDYPDNHHFVHWFYSWHKPASEQIGMLHPILKIVNPAALVRIKANLSTRTEKIIEHQYHLDMANTNCTTAIFYVNNNNGMTIFEDGTVINSVANRFVIFNSRIKHKGTTCTDQKVRCLINFNYFEKMTTPDVQEKPLRPWEVDTVKENE